MKRKGKMMGTMRNYLGKRGGAVRSLAAIIATLWAVFVLLDIVAYLGGGVSGLTIYLKAAASCLCAALGYAAWAEGGKGGPRPPQGPRLQPGLPRRRGRPPQHL